MSGRRSAALLYLGGLGALGAVAGGVLFFRTTRAADTTREAGQRHDTLAAGPRAQVVRAGRSGGERRLELQGEARPYATATVYAKLSGYLRSILVDKGDSVREGQVVATIESPDLDRQYDAAVADAKNKRAQAARSQALVGSGVVSRQEADLADTAAAMADSSVAALASQRSYETLRAPFAGTVTARFADAGVLIQSAANAQTSAQPIVTVSLIDRLRVYVYLDQRDAAAVRVGDEAKVRLPERPGLELSGKVTRVTHELDARTRMMLAEIDLDNRRHEIVAGSFVQVVLHVTAPVLVEIPDEALVFRKKVPHVALVDASGHVHFQPIKIADDDGSRARVLEGVREGDRLALNLGEGVLEGGLIQALEKPDAAPAR